MDQLIRTITIGILATALMDAWSYVRRPLFGLPRPDYRLVGRWFGHMIRGRFVHTSISASPAVRGERVIGWTSHYLIGITFAALLASIGGDEWMRRPTLGLALAVGICTVVAPLLLMQPGMGLGIASARAPRPNVARLQSLITHSIFGLGLYAAGRITHLLPFGD